MSFQSQAHRHPRSFFCGQRYHIFHTGQSLILLCNIYQTCPYKTDIAYGQAYQPRQESALFLFCHFSQINLKIIICLNTYLPANLCSSSSVLLATTRQSAGNLSSFLSCCFPFSIKILRSCLLSLKRTSPLKIVFISHGL